MMQPTEHLDDCPFCGDDARLETEVSVNSYQNDAYYVACSSCGATGPCDDDKHKAIDKWNHPKANWLWVNCDGLPNHTHKTIAVKKGELCPACVAMSERDILLREFRGSLDIEQGLRESRQEIAVELAAAKVEVEQLRFDLNTVTENYRRVMDALIKANKRNMETSSVLQKLNDACRRADDEGDLSYYIDGDLMEAAEQVLRINSTRGD